MPNIHLLPVTTLAAGSRSRAVKRAAKTETKRWRRSWSRRFICFFGFFCCFFLGGAQKKNSHNGLLKSCRCRQTTVEALECNFFQRMFCSWLLWWFFLTLAFFLAHFAELVSSEHFEARRGIFYFFYLGATQFGSFLSPCCFLTILQSHFLSHRRSSSRQQLVLFHF